MPPIHQHDYGRGLDCLLGAQMDDSLWWLDKCSEKTSVYHAWEGTHGSELTELDSAFRKHSCRLEHVKSAAGWGIDRLAHIFVHTITLGVNHLRYSDLGDLDTTCQARAAARCIGSAHVDVCPFCTYVSQYSIDPSRIRSRPASSKAFSSAWRHKHVERLTPAFWPLLQRGPVAFRLSYEESAG